MAGIGPGLAVGPRTGQAAAYACAAYAGEAREAAKNGGGVMSRRPQPSLTVEGTLRYDVMLLQHFVQSGGIVWLGPDALACVLAVQASTDWATGVARLSIPHIARMTGLSERCVDGAMARAIALAMIERLATPKGKTSQWRILRYVLAQTADGSQVPIRWSYVPAGEPARIQAIKAAVRAGDFAAMPAGVTVHMHVHVDQLQVVQPGGVGMQVHGLSSPPPEEVAAWWRKLRPADWSQALMAAGVTGPITAEAKVAAYIAAHPRAACGGELPPALDAED